VKCESMLCLILLALVLQISAKQESNKATKHSNFQDYRYYVNPKTATFRAIDAPVWNAFCI
jgi:hypothetical protein